MTLVKKHYEAECKNGLKPREKNVGGLKINKNAFTTDEIEAAVRFIRNVAEDHALILPGRIPGYKSCDVKILPSSMTKTQVWEWYTALTIRRGKFDFVFSKKLSYKKKSQ